MRAIALVIFASGILLLSGCLDGKAGAAKKATDAPPIETKVPDPRLMYVVATDVASPFSEGVFKMRQTGGATEFKAKKDEPINLTLKNAVGNQYVHNLVLEGYGFTLKGVKDSTVTQIFNATKTGSFKYYCNLMMGPASHRQLGMEGTLTVS